MQAYLLTESMEAYIVHMSKIVHFVHLEYAVWGVSAKRCKLQGDVSVKWFVVYKANYYIWRAGITFVETYNKLH